MAAQLLQIPPAPVLELLRHGPLTFEGIKSRSTVPERDLWRIVDGYCAQDPPLLNKIQPARGIWKYQLSVEAKRQLNIPADFSHHELHRATVAPGPRGMIVKELAKRPLTVKELAVATRLNIYQVNYYLGTLENKCLLAPPERKGKALVYRLKTTPMPLAPLPTPAPVKTFEPTDWRFWFCRLVIDPLSVRRESADPEETVASPQAARADKPRVVILGCFPKWENELHGHYGRRLNLSIVPIAQPSNRQLETIAQQYKRGARVLVIKNYISHPAFYFLRHRNIKHTLIEGWLSSLCRELDAIT